MKSFRKEVPPDSQVRVALGLADGNVAVPDAAADRLSRRCGAIGFHHRDHAAADTAVAPVRLIFGPIQGISEA
jgi:hypothetical protein